MVETPWGDSSSLRNLRLPPGPGKGPDKVLENQRRRLFAAMVAGAAEKGYAGTRIVDLAATAGVSSKAFYSHFPDKESCLLATVDAVLEKVDEGDPIDAVTAYPAAAMLCLLEAPTAGAGGLDRFDRLMGDLEERVAAAAAPALRADEAWEEIGRAYVGALTEVTRNRLLQGRESDLPQVVEALSMLASFYRPPAQPLASGFRRPPPATETLEAPDRAERLFRALAVVVAARGYAGATVGEIVARAGVSNSVFYGYFANKEEAALAAIESGCAQIVAAVLPAFRRAGSWPDGVRPAMQAFFDFLAFRPALGQLVMVTANEMGPAGLKRREAGLRPLLEVFSRASLKARHAPASWFEGIAGAVYHLAYMTLRRDGPTALPRLAPIGAYLALAPFLGSEAATAIAGSQDGRSSDDYLGPGATSLPLEQAVLSAFTPLPASVSEVAAELGIPESEVRKEAEELASRGWVVALEGDDERFQARLGFMREDEWGRLPQGEREALSAEIEGLIRQDVEMAMRSETFDRRPNRVLVRAPLEVDEEGWRELHDLHLKMMVAVLEVSARTTERLEQSGERRISVRHNASLFEMPGLD